MIGFFLFKRGRPCDHFVWSWPTYHHLLLDTRNKNIYGLGVGISVVFEILQNFLFKGGWDYNIPSLLAYHQILFDTRNKNIYWVGFSTVFKIFYHFLYQEGQDHFVWWWSTYHQMLLDIKNKNIQGLGVRISTVFELYGHFLYQSGTRSLRMLINFTPSSASWHKKQVYIWFRGGDLNSFWNIWALPIKGGMGPPSMVMTYIPSNALCCKEQEYIQFWGGEFKF
jgi:hypothetical protein